MAKVAAGVVVALLAMLVLTQIFIPPFAEHEVENRLTQDGGSASVDVSAWPALTLLWGHGRKLKATGDNLQIELQGRNKDPLKKLNKFGEVDIRLKNLKAGAVAVRTFGLERKKGESGYYLAMDATTSPRQMAEEAGQAFGGTAGSLLGGLAGSILPDNGNTAVPISVEGQLTRTTDGGVNVDNVTASVAGLPAGPFAEVIVQSVIDQL